MDEAVFQAMAQSIIGGDAEEAERLAKRSLKDGISPLDAINLGYVPGVNHVGEQFGCGEMYLPDLVLAGEAMKAAVAVLKPEMARLGVERQMLGTVVIGTVEGDIHDIGKTLVATMLTGNGFRVYDLGVNVPVNRFIEKAQEVKADVLAMSALLTTTMVKQKIVIDELQKAGLRADIKVMVGGAPVTREWAEQIGADGTSEDAISAVTLAKKLVGA